MAEPTVGITAAQLQDMMKAVIAAAKEPTEAEKVKIEAEHQRVLRLAKESADLARTQEASKKNRWHGCPHSQVYNGRTFHKWSGQVNSNGFVSPICNICHVEAPPFSAKLLPDEGKQGVNFEQWVRCDKELLAELHQKSFKDGKCDRNDCIVCAKKAA